jgi:hypothetical protein
LGDQWIAKNYKGFEGTQYPGHPPHYFTIYYLYGMERYQSFREAVLNKHEAEPAWYNDGVKFLAKNQKEDGSWHTMKYSGAETALGVLFLVRTTKKAIQKTWGSGELRGARGLPKDLAKARVLDGKIVGEALAGSVDDLMTILANPQHADYESLVNNPENLLAQTKGEEAKEFVNKLEELVRTGDYQQRLVAVQALGRTGNLDNVPALVFALTDPDWRVVVAARNGLRFISRKFNGFGLSENPTVQERVEAIAKWKEWYLSIRPHVEFPEIPPIPQDGG